MRKLPVRPCITIAAKCSVMIVVWVLLSLPTVFYVYRPPSPNKIKLTSTGCANYTKSVCLQVLNQTKNCLSCERKNENYIAISASIDQEANENTAKIIMTGLSLLGASQTCVSSLTPFMCLYLFPLCGANATVSRQQCIDISTVLCKDEWQRALRLPALKDQIPNCESLPSRAGKETVSLFNNNNSKTTTAVQANCSDQFVLRNGTCQPLCDKLKLYSNKLSETDFVIKVLAAFAAVIFGVLLIISSCIWRKKMFVFPSIIILYMAITIVTLAMFALVSSFVDRKTLFCSSQYLTEALKKPTAYCTLTGSIYHYAIIQLDILWLCHVSAVFVKLQFPLHSRGLEESKIIHLIAVLLAVLVPCIPVIAAFSTGGYSTAIYPQALCVMKDPDAAYYSFAIMLAIINGIGVPLLIISFLTAIKHNWMRRRNLNAKISLPTTEMKILVLLCYFILLGSAIQAATTIVARNSDQFYAAILNYFTCELSGTSPECDAKKVALDALTVPILWITVHMLLGAFPAVHILYVVNFGEVKQKCLYCVKDKVCCIGKNDAQDGITGRKELTNINNAYCAEVKYHLITNP